MPDLELTTNEINASHLPSTELIYDITNQIQSLPNVDSIEKVSVEFRHGGSTKDYVNHIETLEPDVVRITVTPGDKGY